MRPTHLGSKRTSPTEIYLCFDHYYFRFLEKVVYTKFIYSWREYSTVSTCLLQQKIDRLIVACSGLPNCNFFHRGDEFLVTLKPWSLSRIAAYHYVVGKFQILSISFAKFCREIIVNRFKLFLRKRTICVNKMEHKIEVAEAFYFWKFQSREHVD